MMQDFTFFGTRTICVRAVPKFFYSVGPLVTFIPYFKQLVRDILTETNLRDNLYDALTIFLVRP